MAPLDDELDVAAFDELDEVEELDEVDELEVAIPPVAMPPVPMPPVPLTFADEVDVSPPEPLGPTKGLPQLTAAAAAQSPSIIAIETRIADLRG